MGEVSEDPNEDPADALQRRLRLEYCADLADSMWPDTPHSVVYSFFPKLGLHTVNVMAGHQTYVGCIDSNGLRCAWMAYQAVLERYMRVLSAQSSAPQKGGEDG